MNVRIECCTVCCGYRDRALALAEVLLELFDARVDVVNGSLGQFDVRVDGALIWSRGENLFARINPPRLPEVSVVIAAIERQALPQSQAPDIARRAFGPEDAKRFYDRFGSRQDMQCYERDALEHMVAHADFEHASAIFEWGCGTGRLAELLLRKHLADNASYVGIDVSTTMVRIAGRRLAN